jgi:hypothetical protein
MVKYLILAFLFLPLLLKSQDNLIFQQVDSLTYQYFIKGQWKELIDLTKKSESQGIESKFLYQRAGYAYFMTSDYFMAREKYENALKFDRMDPVTLEYLYYCGLNTGSEESARYYAENLDAEAQKRLGIVGIKPVDELDLELNYKSNNATTRSDPSYYRIGIKTQLGYRLSLYQSVSYYGQKVDASRIKQPEYYALIKWSMSPNVQIKGAFHGINTKIGINNYPAYLGFLGISSQFKRLNLGGNVSVLSLDTATVKQFGIEATVNLPGKSGVYFTSGLSGISESGSSRAIFSQSVGLKCVKNLWVEGNVTLGNLKNYNSLDALYVYNSYDPAVFRTGVTLFYLLNQHITLIGNFTYDQKEFGNNLNNNQYYNQLSISGGIKWRL